MGRFSLLVTTFVLGWVIAACAGADPTPTLAPSETRSLITPFQGATPTTAVPFPNIASATAAPLPNSEPLPGPTATAAPLSTYTFGPAATPGHAQTPVDSQADCVAPAAGEVKGLVEDRVYGHGFDSAPDTYALKVRVEATALWTSVEVIGVESMTSNYDITVGDGEINVDIEGLKIFDLSRPEGGEYENQEVVLEIDAIVQKRMTRPNSGYGRDNLERPSTSCSPAAATPPRRSPGSPMTGSITEIAYRRSSLI